MDSRYPLWENCVRQCPKCPTPGRIRDYVHSISVSNTARCSA